MENYNGFTNCLVAEDWRKSAAIVGMVKYFDFYNEEYETIPYQIEGDAIFYNEEDIKVDRYLAFAEKYFADTMENKMIESILQKDEFDEEQIKRVNELIQKRTSLKNLFKGFKFDGTNKQHISEVLEENHDKLVEDLYVQRQYGYFLNKSSFFDDCTKSRCKLLGYYVDEGKKGKSVAYRFDPETFFGTNIKEFEFIPFAFTDSYTTFFINDNSSIQQLIETNNKFEYFIRDEEDGKSKARRILLRQLQQSKDFIDYDVEVITKDRVSEYYETLVIKKEAIEILKTIKDVKIFEYSYKMSTDYYINFTDEVADAILNGKTLNNLIELCLKKGIANTYIIGELIKLNVKIKGAKNMDDTLKGAFVSALEVTKNIDSNKIRSYRAKLMSALIARDRMKVFDVLLQLSDYSQVNFSFVYKLYEDFDANIEVAYTFVNALGTVIKKSEDGKNKED